MEDIPIIKDFDFHIYNHYYYSRTTINQNLPEMVNMVKRYTDYKVGVIVDRDQNMGQLGENSKNFDDIFKEVVHKVLKPNNKRYMNYLVRMHPETLLDVFYSRLDNVQTNNRYFLRAIFKDSKISKIYGIGGLKPIPEVDEFVEFIKRIHSESFYSVHTSLKDLLKSLKDTPLFKEVFISFPGWFNDNCIMNNYYDGLPQILLDPRQVQMHKIIYSDFKKG